MADIFDEVGEDLRREQLKRVWQRYSVYIIGVAVLIVVATAGWRGYETWQASRASAAAEAYRAALAKAVEGDHAAAADALVAFSSHAPAGYAIIARMRAATERAAAGEADTALTLFDAVAADGSGPDAVRDLAKLRAAMIAVDREGLDAVRTRVAGLNMEGNAYRHAARELIAMAAIRAEAYGEAREAIAALEADPELPTEFAQRARLMEAVITAAIGPAPDNGEAAS